MTDDIVEVMARAMDAPPDTEYMPRMREFALAALAALEADGYAVVPVVPTEAMRAKAKHLNFTDDIWAAMRSARNHTPYQRG